MLFAQTNCSESFEMDAPFVISVATGIGIGLVSSALGFWFLNRGMDQNAWKFFRLILMSMGIRFAGVALVSVAIVLMFPIERIPFFLALMASIFLGIALDALVLFRKAKAGIA